jgi:hypothetical protein
MDLGLEVVDWINLAQDRDRWWAVVKMVMSSMFHKRRGIS